MWGDVVETPSALPVVAWVGRAAWPPRSCALVLWFFSPLVLCAGQSRGRPSILSPASLSIAGYPRSATLNPLDLTGGRGAGSRQWRVRAFDRSAFGRLDLAAPLMPRRYSPPVSPGGLPGAQDADHARVPEGTGVFKAPACSHAFLLSPPLSQFPTFVPMSLLFESVLQFPARFAFDRRCGSDRRRNCALRCALMRGRRALMRGRHGLPRCVGRTIE